jgi:hypothetical protein
MGSAAAYRWYEWGYQETVLHLRLGDNPDAQIWINHPGEVIHSGYGRPSYWGGSGSLPRVHQYRGLAVLLFRCAPEQPAFTHAWFPRSAFDETAVAGNMAAAGSGAGFALLKADKPFEAVESGPTAGNELRVPGHEATWIVRVGARVGEGSLEEFAAKFSNLSLDSGTDGLLHLTDPEYGDVVFHADGRIEVEGRVVDPAGWQVEGEATLLSPAARTR